MSPDVGRRPTSLTNCCANGCGIVEITASRHSVATAAASFIIVANFPVVAGAYLYAALAVKANFSKSPPSDMLVPIIWRMSYADWMTDEVAISVVADLEVNTIW